MSQKEGMHMHEVSDIANYETYRNCYGFLVSEPRKFAGTHVLLWVGMLLYYIVTAYKAPAGLIVITVLLNIFVQITLIILGFTNPGMIPKILSGYEDKSLRKIPIN
jgi:hypothetical protein